MHIVDISIIVAFLIATLYIGFSSGKKIKTFSDYAVGNRKFSDFAIFCTVAATAIGGNATIGGIGKAYSIGVIQFLAQVGLPISFIIVATFLARRFSSYYGCFSLGDMFYKAYGITGKITAGIIGCIYETFITGIQFIAMGTAISALTGLSYQISLIVSACIILIYTGRGGIRAVTFTDVLQFIVLILAIPILLVVVLGKIGGMSVLFEKLPESYITFQGENFNRYLFLMIPLILPTLSPHHVQRLLMTNNCKQGIKAYYNLSWIYLTIAVVTIFLGLSAKLLFPELPKADQALFALITNYLPVGILGIAVIGVLAVLMSSADSDLNSGSIMLVNDVVIPYNKYIKKKDLSEPEKLKYTRIISLFMGISAIIFASQRAGIFETRILIRTMWFSIILSPLYFLLFNMKISTKGLFSSIAAGLGTFILWNLNIKPITKIDGLFPGFFANVITVLFFYFLGGRQKVFSKEELEQMRRIEQAQSKKWLSIRDLQMRNNTVLGLCLVFLQLMPLVFESNSLTYSKLLLTLINGTMAILLIFGGSLEIFAEEKRFQWLKLTTLFFCLPVTSAYLVVTSAENGLHILVLLFSFIVMVASIEKKHEGAMWIACSLTALLTTTICRANHCNFCWPETFVWQHSLYCFGYVMILFLLRVNINTKEKERKQEKQSAVYQERRDMARSLEGALREIKNLSTMNKIYAQKESQRIKDINLNIAKYDKNGIAGNPKNSKLRFEDLNSCVLSCIEKQNILNKNLEIQLQAKETVFARVDAVLLRRIINNLINVCRHALPSECNTIIVSIDHDPLGKPQILLQSANGGFSEKALKSMFVEDQKLGDELDLGISFREFQEIVTKWHGTLEILSKDDNAIIQLLLPKQNHKKH